MSRRDSERSVQDAGRRCRLVLLPLDVHKQRQRPAELVTDRCGELVDLHSGEHSQRLDSHPLRPTLTYWPDRRHLRLASIGPLIEREGRNGAATRPRLAALVPALAANWAPWVRYPRHRPTSG